MTIRTRFAPSPTGYLHVGGARTALYCWLFARRLGGKFILRIEDTDRERSTQAAIDAILHAMEWLGLDWDEGPFYQMKRLDRYAAVAEQLIAKGFAYRCDCTKERLEELRKKQTDNKEKPRYDGHCREKMLAPDHKLPYVIRFRNPEEGSVHIEDLVHGSVNVQNSELDDLVLVRSDGIPTYNFGVVIDDLDMEITHVIRGDDHLANTPRQINILKALNAKPPIYAHVPMILGSDGKRLSKRHGAVSVQHYQAEGILPEALLNYLVRLGWSHGDQEIFERSNMVELFNLEHINKAPAAFNTEKLHWLNQHYIKTLDPKINTARLQYCLENQGISEQVLADGPPLKEVFIAQQERAKTLKEMAEKSLYFYKDWDTIEEEVLNKHLRNEEALQVLKALQAGFSKISDWTSDAIHNCIHQTTEMLNLKLGKIAQPLRIAVTGGTVSPPIDVTLLLVGKAKVLARLEKAIKAAELKSS